MSTAGPSLRRQGAAMGLSLSLLGAGVGLALLSTPFPVRSPLVLPWWLLIPLYVLAQHFPVDFEARKTTYSVHLTQLPLTLGLVLVAPVPHLVARAVAIVTDGLLLRRQSPQKWAFNTGAGVLEVGLATFAVAHLVTTHRPGLSLWAAIALAVLLNEVLDAAALAGVWSVMRIPFDSRQMQSALLYGLAASSVFTGVAIVALSALFTDAFSSVLMMFLGGGLVLAYRGHRRVLTQQQNTERLYDFVRTLGPLQPDSREWAAVLDRVRLLLHARRLDLLVSRHDSWARLTSEEEGELRVEAVPAEEARGICAASADTARLSDRDASSSQLATRLIGNGQVTGAVTATGRIGQIRGFDLGDLRLLQAVAAELAVALDRGSLLQDLQEAATTDALTLLPNAAEGGRLLQRALGRGPVLVAAVSVDSFREVNDTLGHQIGDKLLREVARRLVAACPDGLVVRLGGARFAVAVPAESFGADQDFFGLQLRSQIEGLARVGAVGTHVRLSVGVVRAPEHGSDAATLLRRAETAMHSAHESHGGPVTWEPAYEVNGQRRIAVVTALREAVASGAVGLAYQPKVDTRTGAVVGVEALARWTHPALGAVPPTEFIPLAEASGLMEALTGSVLRQAVVACRGWQRRADGVGVAVNVSADLVLSPAFVSEVKEVLAAGQVPASLLTLELTEDVVVADPALARERLGELRSLGVKVSIDDFGTGYSSLTYLKGLPMDEVKVDKGFVDHVVDDPADQAVVRAVVDIAHTMGLKVVAEGVENPEQHDVLARLGVDQVQGYLHARPMPALDMTQWLRRRGQKVGP